VAEARALLRERFGAPPAAFEEANRALPISQQRWPQRPRHR